MALQAERKIILIFIYIVLMDAKGDLLFSMRMFKNNVL
jgi:hypothetical protein